MGYCLFEFDIFVCLFVWMPWNIYIYVTNNYVFKVLRHLIYWDRDKTVDTVCTTYSNTFLNDKKGILISVSMHFVLNVPTPVPLFTKRVDILPQDLVKTRSRAIGSYNHRIAMKFDRRLDSAAAETPVEFQGDRKSLSLNHAASRLHEILR